MNNYPSPLARLIEERAKKIRELYDAATPTSSGGRTYRSYLVELYTENTEFEAALTMLAEIAKWFRVAPLTHKEETP